MLRRHKARVQLGRALVVNRAAHSLAHELRSMDDLAHTPAKAGRAHHLNGLATLGGHHRLVRGVRFEGQPVCAIGFY